MNLAAKKNAKKKAAKARKNAEAKKAENEVVEDIAGSFLYIQERLLRTTFAQYRPLSGVR